MKEYLNLSFLRTPAVDPARPERGDHEAGIGALGPLFDYGGVASATSPALASGVEELLPRANPLGVARHPHLQYAAVERGSEVPCFTRLDRCHRLALCGGVILGTGQGAQILAAVGLIRVAESVASSAWLYVSP